MQLLDLHCSQREPAWQMLILCLIGKSNRIPAGHRIRHAESDMILAGFQALD